MRDDADTEKSIRDLWCHFVQVQQNNLILILTKNGEKLF